MGYANNYINVYYTCTKPTQQYHIDVYYDPGNLTNATSQKIPLTYEHEGIKYKVRLADEAEFYKDSRYVIDGSFAEYPGLGNANGNANDPTATSGRFIYDTTDPANIKDGYTLIEVNGKPCFLSEDGYIYIAMTDNRFFWGNRTSYSMSENDPGYSDVLEFLDEYKRQWSDTDKGAVNAYVYNRGYGAKNIYGDDTLTITFRNGNVNYIYYNLSGTICTKHQYADGAVVDPSTLGCGDGTFPELAGHTIGWYEDPEFTVRKTSEFTLADSITLYGRYEKSTITCFENVYYELADPVTVGGTKYTYITENDLAAFADDEKFSSEEISEDISFVDGSGSTVTLNVKTITYKYDGDIVMIRKERPTLSFAEISMNSSVYSREGMYYDEANSLNNLVGYCQYSPVSLRAYFARCRFDVTVDPNHADANAVVTKYNYGQHAVIDAPQRAGYDFDGWTWYRYSAEVGDYVEWDSGAPVLNSQQQAAFVVPGFSVKAVAKWKPAVFSQNITHYFQTNALTFETDTIKQILSGECTSAEAEILLDGSEATGVVYTSGGDIIGVSLTAGDLTYYYVNAVLEQGRYKVTHDDLAAIVQVASVKQEDQKDVSDCIITTSDYLFSYVLYQYKDTIRSYTQTESFAVCAGMQVDYYYLRANDLVIGAQAYVTDGGSGNIVVIGGGSHYVGEALTLSARVPAGFTFLGWYKAPDVLKDYPSADTALSDYTLRADWASAVPVSTSADYTVKVKSSGDYVALVAADEVAVPAITITGKDSLVYGYAESAENAVNAKVRFASDASSTNYVDSYKWYKNGVEITGANSATFLIPQGWDAGEYTLTCEVTVKRRDNLRTRTFSRNFTVEVAKAEIDFKAANYEGNYNK
ncbi:MAG: InlB B-repeat-containing protein, partial [Oscillospiraceae bacterium]